MFTTKSWLSTKIRNHNLVRLNHFTRLDQDLLPLELVRQSNFCDFEVQAVIFIRNFVKKLSWMLYIVSDTLLHWLHKPEFRLDVVSITQPNFSACGFEGASYCKLNELLAESIFHLDWEICWVLLIINSNVWFLCRTDLVPVDSFASTIRVYVCVVKTSELVERYQAVSVWN